MIRRSGKGVGVDWVALTHDAKMIAAGLTIILNGVLIYEATMHDRPDQWKIIGLFLGGVIASAALVFMALRPPE